MNSKYGIYFIPMLVFNKFVKVVEKLVYLSKICLLYYNEILTMTMNLEKFTNY